MITIKWLIIALLFQSMFSVCALLVFADNFALSLTLIPMGCFIGCMAAEAANCEESTTKV
jgi:hypothetical protein